MDRRTFLKRGGFALGGLVAIPYLGGKTIAIAQTTNSNRLSDYARGNGSNEHDAILAWWNSNNNYLIVDSPDGSERLYGFDPSQPLPWRSNLTVENISGENAKFVRAAFDPGPSFIRGNADIAYSFFKLKNIIIQGRGHGDPRYDDHWNDGKDSPNVLGRCISHPTLDPSVVNDNISLVGVVVRNWPGVGIRIQNTRDSNAFQCVVEDSSQGGIVFAGKANNVTINGCTSVDCGDDALAINGYSAVEKPAFDMFVPQSCTIINNVGSQRDLGLGSPIFGAGAIFRGGNNCEISNNVLRRSQNASVSIEQPDGQAAPRDIRIANNESYDGRTNGYECFGNDMVRVNFIDNLTERADAAAYRFHTKTSGQKSWNVSVSGCRGQQSRSIDPNIDGVNFNC